MKKYLNMIMMLCISMAAQASDFMVDGLNYTILSENEVEVDGFSVESLNSPLYKADLLDIPALVEYNGTSYNVVSIGASAFSVDSSHLYIGEFSRVNIPSSVREIKEQAFISRAFCTPKLLEVTLNEGLIKIGKKAFAFNEFTQISLPNSLKEVGDGVFAATYIESLETNNVEYIGEHAFDGTLMTSLKIDEALREIGPRAFQQNWELTELIIPNNVSKIGLQAFQSCPNIKRLIIEDGDQPLDIYSSSFNFRDKVISTGDPITGAGYDDDSMLESIYIGRQYVSEYTPTTGVSNGADLTFSGYSRLTSLTFGSNLTEIPAESFALLPNLTSVTFPKQIDKVAYSLFYHCPNLTELIIDADDDRPIFFTKENTIDGTPGWCFKSAIVGRQVEGDNSIFPSTIENVVLNGGFKEINSATTFVGCTNLRSVSFDCQLTSICDQAFMNCQSISSITLPNTVTSIGADAFRDCTSLRTFINSDNVTVIPERMFMGCDKLSSLHLGERVATVEGFAFSGCSSITGIDFTDALQTIKSFAFQNCTALRTVTLGNNVESINGFVGCSDLHEFRVPTIEAWLNIKEANTYAVPYSLIVAGEEYENLEVPDNIGEIYSYAFQGCSSLKSANLNNITTLGAFAFNNCSNLESINTGNGISIFSSPTGCTSLKSLILGTNVSRLWVLSDCNLDEVTCLSEFPPEADGSTFSNSTYSNAVLTIPYGSEARYKSARCWERFNTIQEEPAPEIPVTHISLNEQNVRMAEGTRFQLSASIAPSDATDCALVWLSSNPDVATVSEEGIVVAVGEGTCEVAVSSRSNPSITAVCQVEVYSDKVLVDDIMADDAGYVRIYTLTGVLIYAGEYSGFNHTRGVYIIHTRDGIVKRVIL